MFGCFFVFEETGQRKSRETMKQKEMTSHTWNKIKNDDIFILVKQKKLPRRILDLLKTEPEVKRKKLLMNSIGKIFWLINKVQKGNVISTESELIETSPGRLHHPGRYILAVVARNTSLAEMLEAMSVEGRKGCVFVVLKVATQSITKL